MSEARAELPEGWKWATLKDVIQNSQTGFASSDRTEDGVIQLRMNNVTTKGGFDWSSYIRVPTSADQIDKYSLEPDDVLFNNTNSVELVGKSVLFDEHKEVVVYSNHFTRL